jgi:hypothetical protein
MRRDGPVFLTRCSMLPNEGSIIRFAGPLIIRRNDEQAVALRQMGLESPSPHQEHRKPRAARRDRLNQGRASPKAGVPARWVWAPPPPKWTESGGGELTAR